MLADALTLPYLCTDATGVLVQAREKCRNGHFFVLVAPERHVLYQYSPRHDSAAVDRLLAGYKGYLVADAHAVYDHLYKTGDVIEVSCWSHARRYYWKALESDPERARQALALIGELFRIERTIVDAPTRKRDVVRERESHPIVNRFFEWCDTQAGQVLDETPIAKALNYARNQRVGLQQFLRDGRLPICNNVSERALRREVTGRSNWLFRRQRRRRRGQCHLRLAARQLPVARHRAVELPTRPPLPPPELARAPRSRPRACQLAPDPRAERRSAAARR